MAMVVRVQRVAPVVRMAAIAFLDQSLQRVAAVVQDPSKVLTTMAALADQGAAAPEMAPALRELPIKASLVAMAQALATQPVVVAVVPAAQVSMECQAAMAAMAWRHQSQAPVLAGPVAVAVAGGNQAALARLVAAMVAF